MRINKIVVMFLQYPTHNIFTDIKFFSCSTLYLAKDASESLTWALSDSDRNLTAIPHSVALEDGLKHESEHCCLESAQCCVFQRTDNI